MASRLTSKIVTRSFHMSKFKASVYRMDFDESLDEKLSASKIKHKMYDGKRALKVVKLSEKFQNAAHKLLLPYANNQLVTAGEKLTSKLWSRHLPLEKSDAAAVYNEGIDSLARRMDFDISSASPEVVQEFHSRFHSKFSSRVANRRSLWQSIDYDSFNGYLYLAFCSASNYASLMFILNDLIKSDPEFKPNSMFSFGSGVGVDVWAVNSIWASSVEEYYCVDTSGNMNKIAELLLQNGEENCEPFIKNVYFRQFLPASRDRKYDLVVSSFSLMELPSAENRLQVIDSLWQKTSNYLLIVEPGTNAGYKAVLEARDYIVSCLNNSEDASQHGHVASPCPHDLDCPRMYDGLNTPCNFEVKYMNLLLSNPSKYRFSYVLLKKGRRPDDESWPRIVRQVKQRHKHTSCELCCADGKLKLSVITRAHHGYNLYKCSRYFSWGDLVPVTNIRDRVRDAQKASPEEDERNE